MTEASISLRSEWIFAVSVDKDPKSFSASRTASRPKRADGAPVDRSGKK